MIVVLLLFLNCPKTYATQGFAGGRTSTADKWEGLIGDGLPVPYKSRVDRIDPNRTDDKGVDRIDPNVLLNSRAQAQLQARGTSRKTPSSGRFFGKILDRGQLRTYYLYIPKSYKLDRPMPLVLVFHGSGGSGRTIASVTDFNQLADEKGFIAVYPNGINHQWNSEDDVSFVVALIDHLMQIRNIDSDRVYATGFSSGGMFTQALACDLSDRIAAFASVAATLPASLVPNCQPDNPVSLLAINGTGDHTVPYGGGRIGGLGRVILSVPKMIELWRQLDSCTAEAQVKSSKRVKISRYSGCRGSSEVMAISVRNGGHRWPDGGGIDATRAIWKFFQRH
ncbi:MAG: hypothetical protein JOZ78_16530 [Chroococcidiopsidaceae cyanobacterium CP_BM_ER_R8_30]|nr:hypothetical protein [Chroococcidiopsidaceae cyanobacterium CP_BM_ER_R8_30]